MAAVGLLGKLFIELAKQAGLAGLKAIAGKLFESIGKGEKGDPNEELKKGMEELLKQMNAIRSDLQQISRQIDEFQIGVKIDIVQKYVNDLESLETQYLNAVEALARASLLAQSEKKQAEIERAKRRTTELGRRVTNEVFNALRQIHVYLAGQGQGSLLYLFRQQSLRENEDMFVHYCRVRASLVMYYMVQATAIELMELVVADPSVDYTDGPANIKAIEKQIEEQETFFRTLIPLPVIKLCMLLAQDPKAGREIEVNLNGVGISGYEVGFGWQNRLEYNETGRGQQWFLRTAESFENVPKNKDFTWYIYTKADGGRYWTLLPVQGTQWAYIVGWTQSDNFGKLTPWRLRMHPDGTKLNLWCNSLWANGSPGKGNLTAGPSRFLDGGQQGWADFMIEPK